MPNWASRTLFHEDDRRFLRGPNSDSGDLIATDPPFNKGRDFHTTPGSVEAGARFQDRWSWEQHVHQTRADQLAGDFPHVTNVIQGSRSSCDDTGAFLSFIAVRLLEMRRVLKPTGSIHLHCDPTDSHDIHHLKERIDMVFGLALRRQNGLIGNLPRPTASEPVSTQPSLCSQKTRCLGNSCQGLFGKDFVTVS